jgi:RND family efflux transporter MFP subunit
LARAEEKEAELLAGVDPDELADAQAKVARTLRDLEEAQAALDKLELTAPFAGVVSDAPANVGDRITGGTTIVVLSDLSTMRAVAQVDELDIMRVREGMNVRLTFDAFPDDVLSGVVGPIPLETSNQDQFSAAVYYEAPVEFDYGALPLKPDMSVTLGFEIKRANQALRLPTMALQSGPTGHFVEVIGPGGAPARVDVEIGVSDGLFTEIVAGLEEGDEVIVPVSGPAQFQDTGGRFIG